MNAKPQFIFFVWPEKHVFQPLCFSFKLKLTAQWSLQNLQHSDKILKKCEGGMLERQAMKSAVHLQQLLPGVICASSCLISSFDLTSSLCPSFFPLILSLAFCRPYIKIAPWFFFYSLCYPSTHPHILFIIPPPSLLSSLPLLSSSTPQTLCLTGAPITMPRVHHHSISQ